MGLRRQLSRATEKNQVRAISIRRLNLPEVVGMFPRGRIREYPSSAAPLEPASGHES